MKETFRGRRVVNSVKYHIEIKNERGKATGVDSVCARVCVCAGAHAHT